MTTVKLGDVVQITSGFAFPSSGFSTEEGIPLVRIRDVTRGVSETRYAGPFDEDFVVNDGDLLVGMDGEFNAALWRGGRALLNQRVCRLVPDPSRLDFGFLRHALPRELKAIEDRTPFVTVKHLSVKDIRAIVLALPPLAEQRRIATILDKADSLRRKRQEAMRLADEFLKAVFFERFAAKSRSRVLTDYCDFLAGFAFKSDQYIEPRDGVRLLRGINVGIDRFEWVDSAGYPLGAVTDLTKYRLEKGDVVLAMDRPWISTGLKCAAVDEHVAGSYLVQRVARLRPKDQGMSAFIMNCLRGNDFKSHCRITETTIPHISPKDFATFPVPNASDAELKSFADIATRVQRVATKAGLAAISTDELTSSLQAMIFNMH